METAQLLSLEEFYGRTDDEILKDPQLAHRHAELLCELESGKIRAAHQNVAGEWLAQTWVKRAILIGFKSTSMSPYEFGFTDKSAYPPRRFGITDQVRMVPGGTAVRRGTYIGAGVVIMPPAYINVGAFVDEGTMVDSHALVGSCAQIGKRVHLSAAAQIGGVLEPAGSRPVVIEDDAFIGGLCGVFEGVVVRQGAVLASGVVLTASSIIFDLVNETELKGEVPANAVVIPGQRPATGDYATKHKLTICAPVIVKYRDAKTDAATALEQALR